MSGDSNKHGGDSTWDSHAAEYARLMEEVKERTTAIPIRVMLKKMDASLPFSSATAIADVGCGPGSAMIELIEAYGSVIPSSAKLVASDLSKGMIQQVQQVQAQKSGNPLWDRLETHIWDLENLDHVPDESLSHVIGSMVFPFLSSQALTNARRILADDGAIALTSVSKSPWMEFLVASSRAVRPDLTSEERDFKFVEHWTTTETLINELQASGFSHVEAEYVEMSLSVDDPTFLLQLFVRSNNPAAAKMTAGFSERDMDALCEEYVRLINERCPTAPKILKGLAIAAIGKKEV